jgi:hypothetical protein
MNCTRCNASHVPDNQLIATEHDLLCPGCAKAIDAVSVPTHLGPILIDEQGKIVIDPAYNPYTETLGEPTEAQKRISTILDNMTKDMMAKLTAVEAEEKSE